MMSYPPFGRAAALPAPRRRSVPALRAQAATLAAVLVLGLSGCVSPAGIKPVARPITPSDAGLIAQPDAAQPALAVDWWRALASPTLDALVQRALADSPNLALVQARLARAQAALAGVQANQGLQVNATADATRQLYSANSIYPAPLGGSIQTLATAQINASWEFDFFGRNRAAIAAAVGVQRAALAETQAARVLVASQVVRSYLELGHLFALREVAARTLQQRVDLLGLISQRVKAGLDTAVEQRQGEGALPDARRQIEQIDERIMLNRHALAVLSVQPPQALDTLVVSLADLHHMDLPHALPADLLGRRADISAARWRVLAAVRETEVARAQFYPNINLRAFVGLSSIGLGRLVQGDSAQYGFGPAVRLPIFEAGALRANLGARTADVDAAIETYNAAVRDGVRDAVDQLAVLQSLARQQSEQAQSHAAAESAYDLVSQRYRAGLATYLAVLNAESELLVQRRLSVDLGARVRDHQVALVHALGGGYDGARDVPN
jgi:NodT family efflux transporter outer membrane factor (OMF) lipoprotein